MPDLDFERITLNAIPEGEMPVFHASQFETMRPFIADLKWGSEDFAPGDSCWCTLSIRKTDDTLVILDDIDIDTSTVSCILSQQSVACIGDNFCQLKVWATEADEDKCIACLNFILHVQPDPEAGGITSESEINNLTEQIEEITQQVIGDDYYTKVQTDALLDLKADKSTTYTKSEVDTALNLKADKSNTYTKSQVDSALALKADAATTYTKTQVDSALALKANSADLATVATTGDYDDLINKPSIPAAQVQSDYAQVDNTQVDYIKNKPDIDAMIADALFAVMPVDTALGPIASFDTELAVPLVNVSCNVLATGGYDADTQTAHDINGYTEANITRCGVNLFDKTNIFEGYINDTNGNYSPNANYKCTDYIPVKGGLDYYIKSDQSGSNWGAWYDSEKNYIEGLNSYANRIKTAPANACFARLTIWASGSGNVDTFGFNYPDTDTTYHPYTGNTYTIAFGQTVYGGVLDVTRGKLKPCIEYPSYNGETLSGRWLSSEATYIEGTTPPTGSQVVSLDDYGSDIDLTPEVISAVVGTNNVYSDTNGDTTVQFKDSIQHYIDTRS